MLNYSVEPFDTIGIGQSVKYMLPILVLTCSVPQYWWEYAPIWQKNQWSVVVLKLVVDRLKSWNWGSISRWLIPEQRTKWLSSVLLIEIIQWKFLNSIFFQVKLIYWTFVQPATRTDELTLSIIPFLRLLERCEVTLLRRKHVLVTEPHDYTVVLYNMFMYII